MRLLNTATLTLDSFFGKAIPDYAILSHRWDDEEVLLQDLASGHGQNMPGYAKIQCCCAQARADGWKYAWIDSCCIDKSSSAELSEAINSMFQWYKDAQVCYAFLSDVDGRKGVPDELRKSAWFTRGWTLQEILAPSRLVFFDRAWNDIGTKSSLEDLLSEITGIQNFHNYETACIAQKMSWASRRETTRVEDEAYCLMGLFDVNMPLLYGEGKKAFKRLQLEVIKVSEDESLFAWTADEEPDGDIFALSPRAFESSGDVRPRKPYKDPKYCQREKVPFMMTNKGLHISMFLMPKQIIDREYGKEWMNQPLRYLGLLHCMVMDDENTSLAIHLQLSFDFQNWQSGKNMEWTLRRVDSDDIMTVDVVKANDDCNSWLSDPKTQSLFAKSYSHRHDHPLYPTSRMVYIGTRPNDFPFDRSRSKEECVISIDVRPLLGAGFEVVWPVRLYDTVDSWTTSLKWWRGSTDENLQLTIQYEKIQTQYPHVYFTNARTKETLLLIMGIPHGGQPWLTALTFSGGKDFVYYSVVGLLNDWVFLNGSNFTTAGTDRISLPLQDGTSASLSLSHPGDTIGNRYILDIAVDPRGVLPWPIQSRLRTFTTWLAKRLVARDHEVRTQKQNADDSDNSLFVHADEDIEATEEKPRPRQREGRISKGPLPRKDKSSKQEMISQWEVPADSRENEGSRSNGKIEDDQVVFKGRSRLPTTSRSITPDSRNRTREMEE